MVDPPSLLPGNVDPPDGCGLGGGVSLEAGPGTLGVDVGGWLDGVDGTPLSVGDGCPDVVEPSDPTDPGDVLGALGGGDPLGGGGGIVTELPSLTPLGVVSEVVDDGPAEGVGLVEPADGVEPEEADGKVDGTSVEETSTSELGWPDVGDVVLLGGKDSGDALGALEPPSLVGDGCELATGLVESPGLPDCGDPDVGLSLDGGSALAESGDAELGGALAEGVLLGVVEDCPDSLPALEGPAELAGDVLSFVWLSLLVPLAATSRPGDPRLVEAHDRIREAERRVTQIDDELATLEGDLIDEREVATALADFDAVWDCLAPREQSRVIELLVERVAYDGDGGNISITFRPSGIKTLAVELAERKEDAA